MAKSFHHTKYVKQKNTISPPLPNSPHASSWIQDIATIGKDVQKEARTIIAKYSRKSAQKAIAKFQNLINIKPKQGKEVVFQNNDKPLRDSLMDLNSNIITHPTDIANKIFIQQSKTNAPIVKTCKHQPQHPHDCTCQVRQYPWHDINGLILQKRVLTNIRLSSLFS